MRRAFVIPTSLAVTLMSATQAAGQTPRSTVPVGAPAVVEQLAGFSVVLVVGSSTPGLTPAGIPPAAARALEDLKDFLPYKSYALVDSQWAIGSRGFKTKVKGVQGGMYWLAAESAQVSASRINIDFSLGDESAADARTESPDMGVARARARTLENQRRDFEVQLQELRGRYTDGSPQIQELRRRLAELAQQKAVLDHRSSTNQPIIRTSFSMDVGETVVVGTSRVDGDRALIVLLTAVKKR